MTDILSNFGTGFLQIIMDFVIFIVNLLFIPFDLLIDSLFPDISFALSNIASAVNIAFNYTGWLFDALGFESFTILLLAEYVIFRITAPLHFWVVKIALRIYNYLKI